MHENSQPALNSKRRENCHLPAQPGDCHESVRTAKPPKANIRGATENTCLRGIGQWPLAQLFSQIWKWKKWEKDAYLERSRRAGTNSTHSGLSPSSATTRSTQTKTTSNASSGSGSNTGLSANSVTSHRTIAGSLKGDRCTGTSVSVAVEKLKKLVTRRTECLLAVTTGCQTWEV